MCLMSKFLFHYFKRSFQRPSMHLPPPWVTFTHSFVVTGVDFAGPFSIADRKGRRCKLTKCWLIPFICVSTKALTLEVVSSLSTDAFLTALCRFIFRCGKPKKAKYHEFIVTTAPISGG